MKSNEHYLKLNKKFNSHKSFKKKILLAALSITSLQPRKITKGSVFNTDRAELCEHHRRSYDLPLSLTGIINILINRIL